MFIALGYGLGDRGFESRYGLGIFLNTTASIPALGTIQPPIQWVPEAPCLGVKRPGRGAQNSSPPSAEVKNAWKCNSTSPYAFKAWCSVKKKSAGTLPFTFCLVKRRGNCTLLFYTFTPRCGQRRLKVACRLEFRQCN
jgi:hypothetical protein